ncbi:Uncharacterised protein [Candidatus Gugararchaeum adminiculabundum]|nr:Uncharacterised protein [Candidatus Gugararchaeum adminiculabundum]
MWISCDKEKYGAGDEVKVEIGMGLGKQVKARGLYATLVCMERERISNSRVMDQYDYDRQKEMGIVKSTNVYTETREETRERFKQEKKVSGPGFYSEETFKVAFTLPADAPPTSHEFGHDSKITEWKILLKLDIPMAPDKNDEVEVFVTGLGGYD